MAKAKSGSTGWLLAVSTEPGVASRCIGTCTGLLNQCVRTLSETAANKIELTGKRSVGSAVLERVRSADDGRETDAVGPRSEERR